MTTRASYTTPQRSFIKFCDTRGVKHFLPATESLLCLWISWLALRVTWKTIKSYLQGVRSLHIDLGLADPVINQPRLERTFRGIKREQGAKVAGRPRLPITLSVLASFGFIPLLPAYQSADLITNARDVI